MIPKVQIDPQFGHTFSFWLGEFFTRLHLKKINTIRKGHFDLLRNPFLPSYVWPLY